MKILKYIFIISLTVFSINSAGFAQVFSFEKNPNLKNVTFPAGTLLKGSLQNQLSSTKNKMGDKIHLLIPFNVKIGEDTFIPARTLIIGQVIQTQKAQQGKNGFVQIKFEYMKFPDGWGTPISAHIWSSNGQGIIGGETTKRVSYKKIPHYTSETGIIAQLIETGKRAMGQEIFINAGSEFIIVLDNDLEITHNLNL